MIYVDGDYYLLWSGILEADHQVAITGTNEVSCWLTKQHQICSKGLLFSMSRDGLNGDTIENSKIIEMWKAIIHHFTCSNQLSLLPLGNTL